MATKQITIYPTFINGEAPSYPYNGGFNDNYFAFDIGGLTISNINLSYSYDIEQADAPYTDSYCAGILSVYSSPQKANYNKRDFWIGDSRREIQTYGKWNFTVSDSFTKSNSYTIAEGHYLIAMVSHEDYWTAGTYTYQKFKSAPVLRCTVEVDDLTINSITPNPANVGDKIKVAFGNRKGHNVTLELTANGKTLDTYTVGNSGGDDEIIEEILIEDDFVDPSTDTYEITCDVSWFQKAGATGSQLNVTVKATDNTSPAIPRTANATFTLKQIELGVTVTAPTYSGDNSYVQLSFTGRENHSLYLTIDGENGNIVSRNNITNSISGETYRIKAPDSWFSNEEGNSFKVTITVEDPTWSRTTVKTFVLNASDNVKPKIDSIYMSNVSGSSYLDGYGYVANYSKVSFAVYVTWGIAAGQNVKVKYGNTEITLTKQTNTYYTGETSTVITGATTFTVTATDARKRTGQDTAQLTDAQITKLTDISVSFSPVSGQATAGDSITFIPSNYIGKFSYTVKTNSYSKASGSNQNSSVNVSTTYDGYFKDTNQQGLASIVLNVQITDSLGRSKTFNYTLNAPAPHIVGVTLTNVPDSRMPSSYGYVANYSKVKVSVEMQWWVARKSITVSYGGNSYAMTYDGEPRTGVQRFIFTTENPITGNTSFTITATDNGNRRDTKTEQLTDVTNLGTLTISPSVGSVEAGTKTNLTINRFVGKYSYTFKAPKGQTTITLASETGQTATKIERTCDASWFTETETTGTTFDITVKVVDQLGREAEATIHLTMPQFRVSLFYGSTQIDRGTLTVGTSITVKFSNRAGRSVEISFKEHDTGESWISASISSSQISDEAYTVAISKTLFTQLCTKAGVRKPSFNIDVTVTAGNDDAITAFIIALPTLGADVTANTARNVTVGSTFSFTFTNRFSEALSVDFYSGTKKLGSTFGPYSANKAVIAAQQYFDEAGVNTSKTLPVTARVYDSFNRSVDITNINILAGDSMKPVLSSPSFVTIQPDTMRTNLRQYWIAGITKVSITLPYTLPTNAKLSTATVKYAHTVKPATMRIDHQAKTCTLTTPDALLVGDDEFEFVVTDERGMSVTLPYAVSPGVFPYHAPNIITSGDGNGYHRCDENKVATDIGDHCDMFITYEISELVDKTGEIVLENTAVVSVTTSGYSKSDNISGDPLTRQIEYFFEADIEQTYNIRILVVDGITEVSATVRLSTAGVIMDFRRGGHGIGLGKVAEHDYMVEVNPDWVFSAEKIEVLVNEGKRDLSTLLETIMDKLDIR